MALQFNPVNAANCHFISRFLTKPWEFGQRQLYFVDAETKSLGSQSSRSLFANRGLNTKETEARLNALVETPVARYRAMVKSGSPPDQITWDVHRALSLIVLLQLPRAMEGVVGKSQLTLDDALKATDSELDSLVRHYEQNRRLAVITTPNDVLFYPSSGVFFLPLKKEAGDLPFAYSYGIPLDLNLVAINLPLGADSQFLHDHMAKPGWFACRSASIDRLTTKVVVPPTIVDQAPNEAQLVDHILECQRLNRSVLESIDEMHIQLRQATDIAGLNDQRPNEAD